MCSNQLSYSGFFENSGLPLFSECKYIAFFYSCKICPTFFHKTSYLYGKIIVLRNVPKNPPTDFRPDYEHIAESGSIRTGIRPAHMGFRHHPRNRRPGYASFRLPQRRGTPRSNPPSHYDLRLHHSPIYAQTDSPGRGDRNHGNLRSCQPPRQLFAGIGRLYGRIAAKLRITGSVIGRPKTLEELYPIDCGDGLRLEDNFHAFTYIYNGRTSVATIGYANLSDKPLTLELRPEEASGLLQADYPRRIAPNERGVLTFSYDLSADKPRYGTLKELLTVCIDGRPTRTDIFLHGFAVDDPRREEQENAPKWQVNKNIINFGPVKRTGAPAERSLTLGNYGKSTLIIRAVETPKGVGCSLRGGERIEPGQACEIVVTFDASRRDYGLWSERLILIANDPARPMQSIRLTAAVEE